MKATTTEKTLTKNFNSIDNIAMQIDLLQAQLQKKREENGELVAKRANALTLIYNDFLRKNQEMMNRHDLLGTGGYLNGYNTVLNLLKELLHEQTQSFPHVRSERTKFRNLTSFVNKDAYTYYSVGEMLEFSQKYNTTDGKKLLHYDRLEFLLRQRKHEKEMLLVNGRRTRSTRKKDLDLTQRASSWFAQKVRPYVTKVERHFKDKLNHEFPDSGFYDIDFSCWNVDKKAWYEHIALKIDTRLNHDFNDYVDSIETPLSMEMLKKYVYQHVKNNYTNVKSELTKQANRNTSMKTKAQRKHNLKTMKAKERRRFNAETWLKIKNTLNLFSGSLVIDKKITFDNYEPEQPKEKTVKVSAKNYGQIDTNTSTFNLFA